MLTKVDREIATAAAWRYVRAFGGELDDYQQEAALAIERARRTFDPEYGRPWPAYAWSAVIRALYGYAAKARAPVSGSYHKADLLMGLRGVALEHAPEVVADDTPERLYGEDEWLSAVSTRIEIVLEDVPDRTLALPVLLDGERAQDVADAHACPRWRVYRATRRVRKRLARDRVLRSLMEAAR